MQYQQQHQHGCILLFVDKTYVSIYSCAKIVRCNRDVKGRRRSRQRTRTCARATEIVPFCGMPFLLRTYLIFG
jgi:hypothetical protein